MVFATQAFSFSQTPEVGRLMLLAFDANVLEPEKLLELYQPSGFIFYVDDIGSSASLKETISSLEEQSTYPLIFSLDQEGGPFNTYQVDNATRFPGNMMLAATRNADLAYKQGLAMGQELAYLGITMDFAPVADVNSNPDNPIIGIRSFGDDPKLVSQFALAFSEGLSQAGVAPVAKHFPGHGNTESDSHLELPHIRLSFEEIQAIDLKPFEALINLPAIMTAHIVFESLDSQRPATLSPLILTNLLRNELGYKGVIISDYLDMQALTQTYSLGEAAVLAIEAGVDLLLVGYKPAQQQEIYDALIQAVQSGRLTKTRIDESIKRIEALTNTYQINGKQKPLPDYAEHQLLAHEIAAQGTTLILNDGTLPLAQGRTLSVISPKIAMFGLEPTLGEVLNKTGLSNVSFTVSLEPTEDEINQAIDVAKQSETLILGAYYWQGNFSPQTSLLYDRLKALGKPLILVSLGNPDILRYLPEMPNAYLACYGFRESNLSALTDIILGKTLAKGQLPIHITVP